MFLVSFGWTGGGCTGRAINSLKFLELETHFEGGFEGFFGHRVELGWERDIGSVWCAVL